MGYERVDSESASKYYANSYLSLFCFYYCVDRETEREIIQEVEKGFFTSNFSILRTKSVYIVIMSSCSPARRRDMDVMKLYV